MSANTNKGETTMKKAVRIATVLEIIFKAATIFGEKSIRVSEESWGGYYELHNNNHGDVSLRTHVQEFINRNNGNVSSGKIDAEVCLLSKIIELINGPDIFIGTKDNYLVTLPSSVRAIVFHKDDYAYIHLGRARMDGERLMVE